MKTLLPPGWTPPKGYANGVVARGQLVFVAGQVGWDARQHFASDDFVGQAAQALENIVAVLRAAGARPEHVVRMTWYVVDKREYLASLRALGDAYRATMGAHGWPLPVADLVLGAVTPEGTLKAASIGDARAVAIQTCEADFYVGLWHEAHGDKPGAVRLLSSLPENCPANVFEGSAVVAELKRLQ